MSKRAYGDGTIRQRKDGTWEGRCSVGRDPGTGKLIRKSFYGKSQSEVSKKMRAVTHAVDTGDYFEPTKMTLSKWIEIWLRDYCGDVKYNTKKHYETACSIHIIPALGAVKLSALTAPMIQSVVNEWGKTGLKGNKTVGKKKTIQEEHGLSPKSIKNFHGILSRCLSDAVEVGYIRFNPCSAVHLPKIEKKEIHPLSDAQIKAFLEAVVDDEYSIPMRVSLFTGMREGELLGLTWDSIDFDKKSIKITKQLQKRPVEDGGYTFETPKSHKPRVLKSVPQYVFDLLREQRLRQIEMKMESGSAWQGFKTAKEMQTALVFTNSMGTEINPKVFYEHYKKIAKSIGIPESRVHDMRHTYAVLCLQNGDDIKTVQENLGHATASFTLDVYGHVSDKMREESANRMQRYISEIA